MVIDERYLSRRKRRSSRSRRRWLGLQISVFILLITLILLVLPWVVDLYRDIELLGWMVNADQALIKQGVGKIDPQAATDLAAQTAFYCAEVSRDLEPLFPLFKKIAVLPLVGPYLGQVEPLTRYAVDLSLAGASMAFVAQPLLEDTGNSDKAGSSMIQEMVITIGVNRAQLSTAAQALDRASQTRRQINPDLLPEAYRDDFLRLDEAVPWLKQGIKLMQALPGWLGADQPQTYLVLVQNRDELRPTGGFITAMGLLRLDLGIITMLDIEDSSGLNWMKEYRAAPAPMEQVMYAYYWVPRDANWSPDFPTAAKQTQELYYLATEYPTKGVIAFDQGAIISMLKILGPVMVAQEAEPIDERNVEAYMVGKKQAAINAGESEKRKDFIAELMPYILEKMISTRDYKEMIRLGQTLGEIMQSGHLLLWFNDPQSQAMLRDFGLDGSVNPGSGDFLMVVDTNMSFSKNDYSMRRTLDYQVDLRAPFDPKARISVHYEHPLQGSEPCFQGTSKVPNPRLDYFYPRCYWDYWRVFTSSGAKLVGSQTVPVPETYFDPDRVWKNEIEIAPGEGGTQMFAGLMVLPQGQQQDVVLETNLPLSVVHVLDNFLVYNLRIQKQAGIDHLPVTIQVQAPDGYVLINKDGGWQKDADSQGWIWQGNITQTQDFNLTFQRSPN